MSQQMPHELPPNGQDQRDDLQAMLAASRELGPEMDSSLVDSYMSRHKTQAPRPQGQQGGQPLVSWGQHGMRYIGFGLLAGALILAAIFSTIWPGGGHGFWFPWFFLPWLFFLMFARRGMYRSRRTYTYIDENGRPVRVHERVRDFGPGYGPGYGPRGSYSNTPSSRNSGYDSNERFDPDGHPQPPRPDASAASDIQSKYGAPDRQDHTSDERTQYRPRYADEDHDRTSGN